MTSNKFPFDVAIASVCGFLIALTIALTFELSPYIWPLVGLIVGPLCYRPWEIGSTVFAFGRDMWDALRKSTYSFPGPTLRTMGANLWATGRVLACILLGLISLYAIPTVIEFTIGWSTIFPNQNGGIGQFLVGTVIATLVGVMCYILAFGAVPEIPARWAMPILRLAVLPIFGEKGYQTHQTPKLDPWTWKHTFQTCAFAPALCQIGILLIPILLLDTLVTIALACASTKRIATMMGVTFACTVAAILALCGITWSLGLLAPGMLVAWFTAPALCMLREYLETSPSTIHVSTEGTPN